MDHEVFKAPKAKKRNITTMKSPNDLWASGKRRRTKEDFMSFCSLVLEYTQYESMKREDLRIQNLSPLDSTGSTAESFTSDSNISSISEPEHHEHEEKLLRDMTSHRYFPLQSKCKPSRKSLSPQSPFSSPRSGPGTDFESDDDSFELITCYCMKPFAGRPMIECNECLTWIHLSCAKIRKNNIPDEFTCQKCKDAKLTTLPAYAFGWGSYVGIIYRYLTFVKKKMNHDIW